MAKLFAKTNDYADVYETLKLLEPILWLSRMPHEDVKLSILAGKVVSFLETVVAVDLPDVQHPHYWIIVRSKGDALTCFGNFFEGLTSEMRKEFACPDMYNAAKDIASNRELPQSLRNQASFAMQRYLHALGPQHRHTSPTSASQPGPQPLLQGKHLHLPEIDISF